MNFAAVTLENRNWCKNTVAHSLWGNPKYFQWGNPKYSATIKNERGIGPGPGDVDFYSPGMGKGVWRGEADFSWVVMGMNEEWAGDG